MGPASCPHQYPWANVRPLVVERNPLVSPMGRKTSPTMATHLKRKEKALPTGAKLAAKSIC